LPKLDDPIAVSIFGLEIRWYALFILTGIVCATALMQWLARQRGLNSDFPLDVAPWVVLAAIVGARLYYLLLKPGHYLDNPEEILNVRLGGLTVHGALAGGAIALYCYCRHRGERFLVWGDLIVPALALGQAIGRWGNWANQEAFGEPSGLPWAVEIDPRNRPPALEQFSTFHPTFLYESILDLGIAAILVAIVLRMPGSRFWREGDGISLYLMLYGTVRFIIESLRTDSLYIGPLPAAYWVSWGLIAAGGAMFALRRTVWQGAFVPELSVAVPPSRVWQERGPERVDQAHHHNG
jgi:phosphatidylglycerol---prolipoprotein diacylglyceryl transferase